MCIDGQGRNGSRTSLRILALLLFALTSLGQSTNQITGIVRDSNGAAISNASISVTGSDGFARVASTNTDGRFSIDLVAGRGELKVEAAGFETKSVKLDDNLIDIVVVLSPLPLSETVTITRTDTTTETSAASVVALGRRRLDTTAAIMLDDRLRQVPGFTLFRRAGSRTANPTTQGVSLRGIGASGASRALVLADGIPLNDPFGSWVYWGRVPVESISQVEVLRGPAGDLYGSSAIGGVISVITRRPTVEPTLSLETSYGTQQTPSISAFASAGFSKVLGSITGEFFETAGFTPVAPEDRGMVDTRAGVRRSVLTPTLEFTVADGRRLFASGEFFGERRSNGTPLQTNDTNLRNFVAGFDWTLGTAGAITLRANGGDQRYNQSFTAIAADRNTETLTRLQHVPSEFAGGSGQWTVAFKLATFFAGFDLRYVRGESDETGYTASSPTSISESGGREFTTGVFAGGTANIGRLQVGGSLRFDHWENYRGLSTTRSLVSGATVRTEFPDRSEQSLSPRLSALYHLHKNVSVAATVATGFRRPTLNELYRNFRVGDILTLANSNLQAERAVGGDAAVLLNGFHDRLFIRGGPFCTEVSRNVSNVTLSTTPSLVTRQRQNVGRTRSCGFESDWRVKATSDLQFSGGYLFVDARVISFPANPELEGNRIPQVPSHQLSIQAEYSPPRVATFALQFRTASSQFDDDLNQFRLGAFATIDAFASRRIGKGFSIFGAVENLFDERIESGRTPVLTLAAPRTARIGLRFRLGRGR